MLLWNIFYKYLMRTSRIPFCTSVTKGEIFILKIILVSLPFFYHRSFFRYCTRSCREGASFFSLVQKEGGKKSTWELLGVRFALKAQFLLSIKSFLQKGPNRYKTLQVHSAFLFIKHLGKLCRQQLFHHLRGVAAVGETLLVGAVVETLMEIGPYGFRDVDNVFHLL